MVALYCPHTHSHSHELADGQDNHNHHHHHTTKGRLYVANAGDSRAVLCRAGGVAYALSEDHKPAQDRETNRIYAAGGFVNEVRVVGMTQLCFCFTLSIV